MSYLALDLVKVGADFVADCVACVAVELKRQGRAGASRAVCCERCREVAS